MAMTKVCLFSPSLSHELETIGYFFRSSGVDVVFITEPTGDDRSEHPWSLQRVAAQNHKLRWISDEPESADLLIAEAFVDPRYRRSRDSWISRSKEVAFLFPHVGMTVKRQIAYLLKSWPHSVTAQTAIFFGDRRNSFDAWSLTFQRRTFYSPHLHPQLFSDEPLNQVFADFSIMEARQYAIGFMGNKNPKERSTILGECWRAIEQAKAQSFWIAYGDNEHQNALTPEQFISALGEIDFCLDSAGEIFRLLPPWHMKNLSVETPLEMIDFMFRDQKFNRHLSSWDFDTAALRLGKAGFSKIIRQTVNRSMDAKLSDHDKEDWAAFSLYVDAVK